MLMTMALIHKGFAVRAVDDSHDVDRLPPLPAPSCPHGGTPTPWVEESGGLWYTHSCTNACKVKAPKSTPVCSDDMAEYTTCRRSADDCECWWLNTGPYCENIGTVHRFAKCCAFDPQQFVGKDCHACTDTRADGSAICNDKDPCAK
ncbi:unnamed protein product [Symbiodinium sp. CCMP2592]|nr:unnamed protein product [Symbiodinium sp. CCMP2592]